MISWISWTKVLFALQIVNPVSSTELHSVGISPWSCPKLVQSPGSIGYTRSRIRDPESRLYQEAHICLQLGGRLISDFVVATSRLSHKSNIRRKWLQALSIGVRSNWLQRSKLVGKGWLRRCSRSKERGDSLSFKQAKTSPRSSFLNLSLGSLFHVPASVGSILNVFIHQFLSISLNLFLHGFSPEGNLFHSKYIISFLRGFLMLETARVTFQRLP